MATACWAFILATATLLEPAPTLDISSLQGTNRKFHQQLIHNSLWIRWGQIQAPSLYPPGAGKGGNSDDDYMRRGCQSPSEDNRSEYPLTFGKQCSVTLMFHQAE
jgi:hypothetical protein